MAELDLEEMLELGYLNGALCTDISPEKEDNPTRIPAEAEKVISRNKTNAYITIGKDRMGDIYSGFGGRGYPNSNAIDLVVGMGQTTRRRKLKKDNAVDPNPFVDSARVYISQRTDLDGHFGITQGEIYPLDSKQGISGIAMKADSVLVLGRRNVKIKAGQSRAEGLPSGGEKDSFGTNLPDARIDLIADAPLEPMVRGDKMLECITGIYNDIQQTRLQVISLIAQVTQLQIALTLHTHRTTGAGAGIAFPSGEMIANTYDQMPKMLESLSSNVADMFSATVEQANCTLVPNKDKYILSKNVFTS